MIHVDVRIPALDETLEFSLNETIKIALIIEEIAFVIEQNKQRRWNDSIDNLLLCNCSNQVILPREKSLYECNVTNGSKLLLL